MNRSIRQAIRQAINKQDSTVKHQRHRHLFALATLAIVLLIPSLVLADELDDISIQVIGLD